MIKNWKSQGGYTGIDIAIAISILLIFTLIISTIFVNIYLQYSEGQRNSTALSYLSDISESIDKMYYQDVTDENIELKISQMNISNGYNITATVERFVPEGKTAENSKDLVKIITIEVTYKVGGNDKTLRVVKSKSKEVLITPNRPKLSSKMVPVKYVVTNNQNGQGYYKVTSQYDTTWYNYENKTWATMMLTDGLIIEGNIEITDNTKEGFVGKKIISNNPKIFVWIPKYAISSEDLLFLYSTSEKYVDANGDLQELGNGYTTSDAFDSLTGFWVALEDYENITTVFDSDVSIENISLDQKQAVTGLSESIYGKDISELQTISNNRKVITIE